ncbi:alpha/beta hydrolase [Halorubellus sp. JP-L1]|uniref:alpha/beta hydrolase n=1 Tax=Halorubellus sp. JP-L1 TaxID=2715753 RepID=UPI0014078364|nr:alpha/beta fold hydrolase [Halorubellus sp. JP-L1]NHN42591.1 alpha/beta hydrolase [Halorubellus sp. JP-L1]
MSSDAADADAETTRETAAADASCPAETVEVRGRTVTYASFGDPDGVPVVGFHGLPGSRAFGAFLDAPARERGVRVLVPDRPGVGGSEPWPERSVADSADLFSGFLDALDVDAAGVLGFSAGGPHALACTALVPERVRGTALLAGLAPPDADVPEATMARVMHGLARRTSVGLSLAARVQTALLSRADPDGLLELFTDAPVAHDVVVDDATVPEVLATEAAIALEGGHRALAAEYHALATDWGFDPYTVGPTVQVLHGRDDDNVPVEAARYYERVLPDAHVDEHAVDHLELVLDHAGNALDAAAGQYRARET